MKRRWDTLWLDGNLATMEAGGEPYGSVLDGAIAVREGRLDYVGPAAALGAGVENQADRVIRLGGAWVTPGLIDCHTHLVFAGDRSGEFARRLSGVSYETIAREGGGIASTVRATRAASLEHLVSASRSRLRGSMLEGVTTVEIKSGYGLELETELRMLRAARQLGRSEPIRIVTTYLGAHALPPDFDGSLEDYVDRICGTDLLAVAESGLADAVDAFCEGIAFSPDQVARVFSRAKDLNLPVKLHADQLSDLGGAALVARFDGLSADHVEYTSPAGVHAMADAGTTAVLLPHAFFTLGETQRPPVGGFRTAGVPMAVATDCNPGSSPTTALTTCMNQACTLFGLTPEEALAGVTRHAARALGLSDTVGTLTPGLAADLAIWDIRHPSELAYWTGGGRLRSTVFRGLPRDL